IRRRVAALVALTPDRRARRAAVAATFFLCAPLAVAEEGAIQGPDPVRPSADGLPLVAAQSWTLPQVIVTPPAAKKKPNAPPKRKSASPPAAPPVQPAPAPAPSIEVGSVRMSPVAGSELPIGKVPGTVTTVTPAEIARSGAITLGDALQQSVPGVILPDQQGNVFQTDIQYRGFSASPVDGLPQGVAVYQNGVRINESFGDTLNWAFLPSVAIDSITVMSNNPVFGLNAIGGAVSIAMKDGFGFQGVETDTRFGSYGRRMGSLQAGSQSGTVAAYI